MIFKNYAVVGHPVGHTMSPFIHARLFALCGQSARYGAKDIPPEDLSASVAGLRGLDGFNVTIPHKRAIIPLLDDLDRKAAAFGSVNTVRCENSRMTGYTTDGEGFRMAVEAAGAGIGGKTAVLGAGGAARAIAFEAVLAGGCVTVATREHSAPAAEQLCADIRSELPDARVRRCLIPELRGRLDLLVNATPAGMYPNPNTCAAPDEVVANADCVFDAVYNPSETRLLRMARALGKKVVGGMGMLVCQAAAAQGIWSGARFGSQSLRAVCAEASLEMRKKFGVLTLCGFMGSGKTTVGELLAGLMGRRFVDMDRWIEQKEGATVPRIFSERGEAGFRRLERAAVRELSMQNDIVLSAGGGTLLDKENAAALRANGVVIFLDASLEEVRRRLRGDRTRPLLQGPDSAEKLAGLYRQRLALYRAAADFSLNADLPPHQVAEAALRWLEASAT